ncbi:MULTISPECIES: HPP family protein [unclassified Variovorax]|uniref:HPP family protein n=1 Tax=unclassified Variovorax TaxID=663243 RepID=UPI001BD52CA9|nr:MULTISPECIES: HPP family protein [unclassified Variovorax]
MAGTEARTASLRTALRAWLPARARVDSKERLRAVAGALLGLLLTGLVCRAFADLGAIWLVAPLGASAVLVFAVPASPLAQPWSAIGGNTVSALVGIACANLLPDPALAGALATALAIGLMFSLRCLHPPGGAMALLVVLTHTTSFSFALFPAMANSVLLVLAGVAYNTLTGRRYPHIQSAPATPPADARFSSADVDAVLARYNQVLDISRDDLESLIQQTEVESFRRRMGELRCADIMSREPMTVEFGTSLQEAWQVMQQRHVKALPVTDRTRRVVGIVTQADFFRHIDLRLHQGLGARLRSFLRPSPGVTSSKAEVVGQIMTKQVRVATDDRPALDLVPLFSDAGHHHIPIIDGGQRLVGMITQSDFVRALYRAVRPGG